MRDEAFRTIDADHKAECNNGAMEEFGYRYATYLKCCSNNLQLENRV